MVTACPLTEESGDRSTRELAQEFTTGQVGAGEAGGVVQWGAAVNVLL